MPMSKVLLTRIGCRYTCSFCNPTSPYKDTLHSHEKNFETIKKEVDSTSKDCNTFVIGGSDCNEDLGLLFRILAHIRKTRNKKTEIHIQSHCGAFQDVDVVGKLCSYNVSRILLPLYGATKKVHHSVMTPKPGVKITGFPQLDAIKNAMRSNIAVSVHTVITKTNKDDLTNIINELARICAKCDRDIEYRITPVYYVKGGIKNYISVKDLSPSLNEVHKLLINLKGSKRRLLNYSFLGFPFCLFNRYDDTIANPDFVEKLKKEYIEFVGNQLPFSKKIYSKIDPHIPNYRIRMHAPICKGCMYENRCAGFQRLDYEAFGIGNIKPFLNLSALEMSL